MEIRPLIVLLPVLGLGVAAAASGAMGAGFQLREQTATAQSTALAGATASAEDISYMFFNPAGLTRQFGHQVVASGAYLRIHSDFDLAGASTATGVPLGGGEGGSDIADDVVVAAFYGMLDISPDWRLGLGLNAPFGLSTDYNSGWAGRYHALKSELTTVNINPAIAYRMTDQLSLGAGLQVAYADAELTNAIDFGSLDAELFGSAFGGLPGASDGKTKVDGDDWGLGFNLGLLLEPWSGSRLGLAYRSKISHNLKGNATFDTGGPVGEAISAATDAFVSTNGRTSLELPETVSIGLHHDVSAAWSLMAEAAWTNWSRFDELRIKFDNSAQVDSLTEQDWDDSWFVALGGRYRPSETLTLSLGVAYDQTPIPNSTRTPRIPGDDRYWLSAGLTYRPFAALSIALAYTHAFVDDASLNLSADDPGNQFRGNLSGDYDSAFDIFSFQASYRF